MDSMSRLSSQLQQRTKDIIASQLDRGGFHYAINRYWEFISTNQILAGILTVLASHHPELEDQVASIISNTTDLHFSTNVKQAAFSYFGVKLCGEGGDNKKLESTLGFPYNRSNGLLGFKEVFIQPLARYLIEQLEDGNHVLSSLIRYKEKVEWFRKQELYDLYQKDTSSGEKRLIYHLYEYLFDEGIPFSIEPDSASGRPDLIGEQVGDNKLVADAKVYKDGSDTKGWLNQVYTYTEDYNESVGYVVIYNVADAMLDIESDDSNSSVPVIIHNHKTIFFVVVDIKPDRPTASKRGQLKKVTITRDELIQEI